MLTIDEALKGLPRATQVTKTATVTHADTPAGFARALAGALRQSPEPEVSWASLNAVKTAGFRTAPPALPVREAPADDERAGTALRKLAHAVRCSEDARAVQFFEKNACALRAVRGLTLLRERTQSP